MRKITEQQKRFIAIKKAGVYTVRAVAGSGKTFTALEFIKANPSKKVLYLVFNSSNRAEMKERLEMEGITNAEVHTVHSFCYGKTVSDRNSGFYKVMGKRVRPNNITSWEVANLLQISNGAADKALKYYIKYLHSEISTIQEFVESLGIDNKKVASTLAKLMVLIEDGIINLELKCPHDFYVKWFSMKGTISSYDTVVVDEAQDVSPVMLSLIDNKISYEKLIFVGDGHQWIYGWRNAINAMSEAVKRYEDVTELHLSKSFRVGKEIAELSSMLNGVEVIGEGTNTLIEDYNEIMNNEHVAILGFTNFGLFNFYVNNIEVLNTKKVYFRNFDSRPFWNMINFASNKFEQVYDSRLLSYESFDNLIEKIGGSSGEESEENRNKDVPSEYCKMVDIIKRFTIPFLKAVLMSINNSNCLEGEEEILLTTVHTCKGAEFDNMILLNDGSTEIQETISRVFSSDETEEFRNRAMIEENTYGRESLNLIYVALTRAKGNVLFMNDDITKWYKNIYKMLNI